MKKIAIILFAVFVLIILGIWFLVGQGSYTMSDHYTVGQPGLSPESGEVYHCTKLIRMRGGKPVDKDEASKYCDISIIE